MMGELMSALCIEVVRKFSFPSSAPNTYVSCLEDIVHLARLGEKDDNLAHAVSELLDARGDVC